MSIQCILRLSQSVSQSELPQADYKVEVVCGESQRGVAVCMLHASLSFNRGPWQSLVWPAIGTPSLSGNQSVVGRSLKAFHWS